MKFSDVPKQTIEYYLDFDFDDFIKAVTGKQWSVQQSLLDCDSQAGNGVMNSFAAYYKAGHPASEESLARVEEWLKDPPNESFYVPGRYEHEGITTDDLLTWLVAKNHLPFGWYTIKNEW